MNRKWLSIVSMMALIIIQTSFLTAQPYGDYTLKYNGGDDVYNGGMASFSSTTATVELWVKFTGTGGAIFTKMNSYDNPSKVGVALEYPNTSQMVLSVGYDGGRNIQPLSVATTLNTWYHIAVTFNSGTATLFVNGVSKGTSTGGSTWNAIYPFAFGSFTPWGGYSFNGEIGDIRIFNTVRTPSQISSDMASSEPEGALAFWSFNDASADTVADLTGNGNTGFLGTTKGSSDTNDPQWNEIQNPDPITGIWALAGNNSVTVKWNKSTDADFERYQIFGGTDQNNLSLLDYSTNINDTTLLVNSGLTNDALYYFSVRQKNIYNQFSAIDEYDAAVPTELAGRSLIFDSGFGHYVQVPSNNAPLGDHAYTIEAWIKPTIMGISGILGYGDYGEGNMVNAFRLGQEGTLINYWWGNDLTVNVGDITGSWHHVAVSYDGDFRKMYLDGVLIGSDQPTGMNVMNSSNLTIGNTYNGEFFDGEIDEVRLWNIARTETEIADNMNLPLRGDESGLVLLFHFDEAMGSIAYDASSSNSNGVWVSDPSSTASGAMSGETLPVELSAFTAQSNNGKIQLNWSTASESNNAGWEVESRSQNSEVNSQQNGHAEPVEAWTKIGFIPGKGTTTESHRYQFQVESSRFQDQSLQFRLKQIDLDGKFTYSNILSVDITPNSFGLSQNYPNPFNPVTVISYQLSVISDVKLVVFDLLGREVATLVNEKKAAGSYTASFDGANLTSGVYLYKLTAGNYSETRKMTLVK